MSQARASDSWPGVGEPPAEVEITLLERDGLGLARRMSARGRWAVAAVLAVIAAAALAIGIVAFGDSAQPGSGRLARHPMNPQARLPGARGVAAAYGYPLRCLIVTLSADGAYARADFNHATLCGRYAGDPTAIFHRVAGAWRPVLDAVSYPCPLPWAPGFVQRQLAVCP